jgi:uncharacterized membrane protein
MPAYRVTALFGFRRFTIIQTVIVAVWIGVNLLAVACWWDRCPFIPRLACYLPE